MFPLLAALTVIQPLRYHRKGFFEPSAISVYVEVTKTFVSICVTGTNSSSYGAMSSSSVPSFRAFLEKMDSEVLRRRWLSFEDIFAPRGPEMVVLVHGDLVN